MVTWCSGDLGGNKPFEQFFGRETADIQDGLEDGKIFMELAAGFIYLGEVDMPLLAVAFKEKAPYFPQLRV